jgi:hypothetical protein
MKQNLILLLAVLMVSCHKPESKSIELIALKWSSYEKPNNDTLFTSITCRFYAQINENGTCILNAKDSDGKNQFVTFNIGELNHQSNHNKQYPNFKNYKEILDNIFILTNKPDFDSTRIERKKIHTMNPGMHPFSIYAQNKEGKNVRLQNVERNCNKLYEYLESLNFTDINGRSVDSVKILDAEKDLLKEEYEEYKKTPVMIIIR